MRSHIREENRTVGLEEGWIVRSHIREKNRMLGPEEGGL